MKKLLVLASLVLAPLAFAQVWVHVQDSPGVYSATANIPSAATCQQFGAAYGDSTNFIVNNGPLGSYTRYPGNPLNVSGPISAGNYSILQQVYGSGYSGTVINW